MKEYLFTIYPDRGKLSKERKVLPDDRRARAFAGRLAIERSGAVDVESIAVAGGRKTYLTTATPDRRLPEGYRLERLL